MCRSAVKLRCKFVFSTCRSPNLPHPINSFTAFRLRACGQALRKVESDVFLRQCLQLPRPRVSLPCLLLKSSLPPTYAFIRLSRALGRSIFSSKDCTVRLTSNSLLTCVCCRVCCLSPRIPLADCIQLRVTYSSSSVVISP